MSSASDRLRLILWAPLIVLCLILQGPIPASAEFSAALSDSYLETHYQWGMYLDSQDVDYYLNYRDSWLHPLSQIRVHFRNFTNPGENQPKKERSKVYEEFWYHGSTPIGLRQRQKLKVDSTNFGAIVVGKVKGRSDRANALSNALLRLLIDLHFQEIYESAVLVPSEQYDMVMSYLHNYHFFERDEPREGPQMSIHLLSYPAGRDTTLYLM